MCLSNKGLSAAKIYTVAVQFLRRWAKYPLTCPDRTVTDQPGRYTCINLEDVAEFQDVPDETLFTPAISSAHVKFGRFCRLCGKACPRYEILEVKAG